ncbi:ABC transporter ATP-binding protein [Mesorhizobium retamae]|uniref:ABC transporter ATP-binding protein n=1 Tax=Mesorhizobium retamae TaxID=2912854 RepID=A0ABS9Q833_9HYPH|nr:ABC transporter ATP-binding protein [Mesorhizobium sp. IRAMC:0171]MCG7503580.1 ABC transporter ATP-binding protein [Mesorhizobium sp. IRAMC:0171]
MLEVTDLEVAYGDVRALWGVSIHVDAGSVVAIVGANGAGKTTLLKAISGLVPAKRGEIKLSGTSLLGRLPEDIARLGIAHVPEGRGLFRQMTVLENLELGAFQPKARANMKRALEKAYDLFPRLKERTGQKAGSLSGGEQQMLAIARATMSEPSLLILDEPSIGLSPLVVQQMFQLIEALHKQGVTILLVEQNIHQALKIADYAFVLKTGELAMQGTGAELIADPEVQKAYMGVLEL